MINILLTNPGQRDYFIKSLIKNKKIKLFLSDPNINASSMIIGLKNNVNCIRTPKVKDKNYIKSIIKIIKKYNIKYLFPLSDHDLILLSKIKSSAKKLGCEIVVSETNIIKICRDKLKLSQFCKDNNFYSPKIFLKQAQISNANFLLKKINGSGSEKMFYGKDLIFSKLNFNKIKKKNYLVQKMIFGKEYGVDILNDLKGKFVDACIKEKISMKNGETQVARVVINKKIFNFAKKISDKLKHVGNLDCDVIIKNRKIYILDFNNRFGGGYPATYLANKFFFDYLVFKNKKLISKKARSIIVSKGVSIQYKKL